jgi:hypothetical protein
MKEEYKYEVSFHAIFSGLLFSVSLSDPKYCVLSALIANTVYLCMFCAFPS